MKLNLSPLRIDGRHLTRRQKAAVEQAVFMAKLLTLWTTAGAFTYWLLSG